MDDLNYSDRYIPETAKFCQASLMIKPLRKDKDNLSLSSPSMLALESSDILTSLLLHDLFFF